MPFKTRISLLVAAAPDDVMCLIGAGTTGGVSSSVQSGRPTPAMTNFSSRERIATFNQWLESRGVTQHQAISIQPIEGHGHGLIAIADLEPGTILFKIPRPAVENSPLLTIGTSTFLDRLGFETPDAKQIAKNWVPLLVTMMWERARAYDDSVGWDTSWRAYFEIMPTEFDTLMFWSEEELMDLEGSTVLDTIGRQEAEADYHQLVAPLIRSRPDLFPVPISKIEPDRKWEDFYGLDIYHRMGSLVLSRSFEVDVKPGKDDEIDLAQNRVLDKNDSDSLINTPSMGSPDEELDFDEVEEEEESSCLTAVAMVPLADMLNAKSGCENAKLFYEPTSLNMTVTKFIKAGEQIYNTYANPPNADLLRRYGHVDDQNPFDLAEVSLELCLKLTAATLSSPDTKKQESKPKKNNLEDLEVRAVWAMEMGLDDIFMLPTRSQRESNQVLPPELATLLRIFLASDEEFQSWKIKEVLPKPIVSEPIARLAIQIITARLQQYPTSIQIDEEILKDSSILPSRKRKAIMVRLSEKKILEEMKTDLSVQFPSSLLLLTNHNNHNNGYNHQKDLKRKNHQDQNLKSQKSQKSNKKFVRD